MSKGFIISLVSFVLILVPKTYSQVVEQSSEQASVMSFNVENLFDEVQDTDGANETIIPRDILEKKLAQIAKGILQVNEGKGPDILLIQEVENIRVLKMLNEGYLQAAGYQTVELLPGDDERGINTGVLSRFKTHAPTQMHLMPFNNINRTRGILEVFLQTSSGKKIRAYTFHFPSQANPGEQRKESVEFLNQLISNVPTDEAIIAGGDSNITEEDAAQFGIYTELLADKDVSHIKGCSSCVGTEFFKGAKKWNFFDILVTKKGAMHPDSVMIADKVQTQRTPSGIPMRFDPVKNTGMSDHLPIFAVFTL